MDGEFRICHNELVLCAMNPPIQAATVGSREIWEEKSAGLCGSGFCESALRGRSNEPCWKIQQQPIIASRLCKPMSVSHCHLRLESSNIKTRSAEGSIAIWFLEICLKIFVMYLVFWVLFGLVDPVFGTAGLALGIVCLAFEIVYLGWSMVKKEMVFHRYRMWVSLTSWNYWHQYLYGQGHSLKYRYR